MYDIENFIDVTEELQKARVKAHTRKTKTGKLSQVKEYEDSRKKKQKESKEAETPFPSTLGFPKDKNKLNKLKVGKIYELKLSGKGKKTLYFENNFSLKKLPKKVQFVKYREGYKREFFQKNVSFKTDTGRNLVLDLDKMKIEGNKIFF